MANRKLDTIHAKVTNKIKEVKPDLSLAGFIGSSSLPKKEKEEKQIKIEKVPDKQAKEKKKIIKPHHKKIAGWVVVLISFFFVTTFLAGAVFAHQEVYANKVYPGVVVWGEEVGGKTVAEVQEQISQKIENYSIDITGPEQSYKATISELGLVFNSETMSLSAFSKGRTSSWRHNYLTRVRLLGTKINWQPAQDIFRADELVIPPSYAVDEKILDEYLKNIGDNLRIEAKDSTVEVKDGQTVLTPAIYGREVVAERLKKDIIDSLEGLKVDSVVIETERKKPAIIDNSAREIAAQAEAVMSHEVVLTYQGQTFKASKETVGSWITFVKAGEATNYTLLVEPKLMKNYFSFLGTKLNIYPVNKKVQVENGNKQVVIQEGKEGLLIDETALGKMIAEKLPTSSSVQMEIPMYVAKYKTLFNNVLVANWAKYIEINISTQTMTAYLAGGQVVGSWKVTTGNRYHPTPVGTWLVHGKSAVTRMSGGTPGVDYYDLPNVHWVTWFKGGGYSIHEAYWRTVFGGMDYVWNGSHGCVNSPYSVAKFIYDWAPIGTPVVVHY